MNNNVNSHNVDNMKEFFKLEKILEELQKNFENSNIDLKMENKNLKGLMENSNKKEIQDLQSIIYFIFL